MYRRSELLVEVTGDQAAVVPLLHQLSLDISSEFEAGDFG